MIEYKLHLSRFVLNVLERWANEYSLETEDMIRFLLHREVFNKVEKDVHAKQ